MQVTLDIPDALTGRARSEQELSRKVSEALAVEGYLSGALTRAQVAASLGMTFCHDPNQTSLRARRGQ